MRKPSSSASSAAAILGSIRTPRKARSSRLNGRLGGRPSSCLCSERELRARVRASAPAHGITVFSRIRYLQQQALALRRAALSSPTPLRYVLKHRDWWALLIPKNPYIL